ncbi:uncharacterized protein LALA0_S09e04676g [Lachancea lanzarotensis]|uniref:LALA0S09e04676g1_1 n=1 Tax=Lachancea lanzarotensis TaxID=1245769 RepID=A0A0C7NBX5_9SACH|nr:uncharacterized protein LALA0_S09e04676g [Lachancea lanzarotensis]CEP63885.1 LALA0S09e04676g1_1 [Lachancea lanzarotensis]
MSSGQPFRDHVSSVLTNITTLEPSQRKPLTPKPVNLSHLVESQKLQQRTISKNSAVTSRSSVSKLIVKPRNKRPEHGLKPLAGLIIADRPLQFAKCEYRNRPRKKIQSPSLLNTGTLVNRIMKCVNAFETSLTLQRHKSTPVQFDMFINASNAKQLSSTEIMIITEDLNDSMALILHDHTGSNVSQRRGPFKLLLSSQSSLTLYSGLKWYFEWQVL